ncbi:NPCBM/NEW2 domain-containing protein [Fontivita pretiosa]|uniref:NPCBM/NEW2 domain-containing protein n=1 Tax=Fontivita pretiosa TaxID=2989684 RepID=UPI003D17457B
MRRSNKPPRHHSSISKTGKTGTGRRRRAPGSGQPALRSAVAFESLELRQLMATVNVNDYGATPNDGRDDSAAINAAIRASGAGDIIQFGNGIYTIGEDLEARGEGRIYQGSGNTTLQATRGYIFHVAVDNATFRNLILDGPGIQLERAGGGMNSNIVIDNNEFRVRSYRAPNGSWWWNGVEFTTGLRNSQITNNRFTSIAGDNGIFGYYWDNLRIANNEFLNGNEGIHVIDHSDNSRNLLIEQNYFAYLRRMGIEYQGGGHNTIIQDNFYEKPVMSGNFHDNDSTFAYSIIADRSVGTIVRRNTSIAPERPDGTGVRVIFEIGGDNALIEDNYSVGGNHVVAANDFLGSTSVLVRNNRFVGYRIGPSGRNLTSINNGPDVQLTWDINRGRPGPNRRFGGTGADNNPPVGEPTDPTTPKPTVVAPARLQAILTDSGSVLLSWRDQSADEQGFKIERSGDGGATWEQIATVSANRNSYVTAAQSLGIKRVYSYRVRSYNANGDSAYTNVATPVPIGVRRVQGVTYLSDLRWTKMVNHPGQGSAERDRSNGELFDGDGRIISLRGRTYEKGIGVHAGSEIRYALDGKYTTFLADIGLDDETAGAGSVIFEVWADGARLYSSGVVNGSDPIQSVNVNVSGKRELVLIVRDNGSDFWDHADWANARLVRAISSPRPVEPRPDPQPNPGGDPTDGVEPPPVVPIEGSVYLSDIRWQRVHGEAELDRSSGTIMSSTDGGVITLNGTRYAKGLGVHSTSRILYNLDGKYSTFISDIGLDDAVGRLGSVVFQVWADGAKLYDSGRMTGASATKTISIDVAGKKQMWLVVDRGGDDRHSDQANWAGARLTLARKTVAAAPRPTGGENRPAPTPAPTRPTAPAGGSDVTYLSHLPIVNQTNTRGPVEIDSSVGQVGIDDGRTITLNGVRYTRGIGTHSDSKLVYNLAGQYTTFITDLGIDDEVGNRGSVVFEIWTDGTRVFDSGRVTGASATQTAVVNVAGKSQLWLVVRSAGDGYDSDHADWAGARLLKAA